MRGKEVEAMDCESDRTEGDMCGNLLFLNRNLPSLRIGGIPAAI